MPKQKQIFRLKRQHWPILAGAAVVLGASILLLSTKPASKTTTTPTSSPSSPVTVTPTASAAPSNSGQPANGQATPTSTPTAAALSAPILQMSSGNNGPVPIGAIIEFVCRTSSQQDCSVTLTEKSSGKLTTLPKKTNQSDSHGTYGSTWDWTAASGTWKVVATASKGSSTAASQEQTLEVE